MSRLPWKTVGLLLDLERQIDRAFEELIHKPWGGWQGAAGPWPPVDVYDTPEAYFVVADLPGVAPAALELTVTDNELTIRASRDVQSECRQGQSVRIEREVGEFSRRIRFDRPVDRASAESRFEQGQLIVRLTKKKQP